VTPVTKLPPNPNGINALAAWRSCSGCEKKASSDIELKGRLYLSPRSAKKCVHCGHAFDPLPTIPRVKPFSMR